MQVHLSSTPKAAFELPSAVMTNSTQCSTVDTLASGAKKDETNCFSSLFNIITWPFRKIGELLSFLFCCGSNSWILNEMEKDPEAAAKAWIAKYPDPQQALQEFKNIAEANPDRAQAIGQVKAQAFLAKLTSLMIGGSLKVTDDDAHFLSEIKANPVIAAQKWAAKYPNPEEGMKQFGQLILTSTGNPELAGMGDQIQNFIDALKQIYKI